MNLSVITLFVKFDPKTPVRHSDIHQVMVEIENAAEAIPGVFSAQAYKEGF